MGNANEGKITLGVMKRQHCISQICIFSKRRQGFAFYQNLLYEFAFSQKTWPHWLGAPVAHKW